MKLLIDIGNTRLKWALAGPAGELQRAQAISHEGDPVHALAQLPQAELDGIWLAQVTGMEQEARIDAALQMRYGRVPVHARSADQWHGLRNAYREPWRLGVDRWLVMVAAWAWHPRAFCVVDAGTALTVDCVAADGRHLGGVITAGLHTQQRAVLGATRFATRDTAQAYDGALGTDTEACVRQGAMLACLGAIDRASALAGLGAVRLITGGDAHLLLPHLPSTWMHRPNLVLEGLLALAHDRSSGAGHR